jgi:hypothetical protein
MFSYRMTFHLFTLAWLHTQNLLACVRDLECVFEPHLQLLVCDQVPAVIAQQFHNKGEKAAFRSFHAVDAAFTEPDSAYKC